MVDMLRSRRIAGWGGRLLGWVCLWWSMALWAGCGDEEAAQETAVLVEIDAEARVRQLAERLRVTVAVDGVDADADQAPTVVKDEELGGDTFPRHVALLPAEGREDRSFVLTAQVLRGETAVAEARLVSGYVPGQVRYPRLVLQDSCLGELGCSAAQSCEDGRCEDATVLPGALPTEAPSGLEVDSTCGEDAGPCAECVADADCEAAGQRCVDYVCVGCVDNGECTAVDAPRCAGVQGCTGCLTDADCSHVALDGVAQRICGSDGRCVECTESRLGCATPAYAHGVVECVAGACAYGCSADYRYCASGPECRDSSVECCDAVDCTAGAEHQEASCDGGVCSYQCAAGYLECEEGQGCVAAECCKNTDCVSDEEGVAGKCTAGVCVFDCAFNYIRCPGASACVPGDCCSNADCAVTDPSTGTSVCEDNSCVFSCATGYKECLGDCIPEDNCCTARDCGCDSLTLTCRCVSGVCRDLTLTENPGAEEATQ